MYAEAGAELLDRAARSTDTRMPNDYDEEDKVKQCEEANAMWAGVARTFMEDGAAGGCAMICTFLLTLFSPFAVVLTWAPPGDPVRALYL